MVIPQAQFHLCEFSYILNLLSLMQHLKLKGSPVGLVKEAMGHINCVSHRDLHGLFGLAKCFCYGFKFFPQCSAIWIFFLLYK